MNSFQLQQLSCASRIPRGLEHETAPLIANTFLHAKHSVSHSFRPVRKHEYFRNEWLK